MKTIFLNRYFYPDHTATSQMLSDLAFALVARGFEVHVITSRQRYDDPRARLPAREHFSGVEVYRMWTSRFGRQNLPGRAIDYATFYISAGWTLWRLVRQGDVIVTKTDPPMLSLLAAPVARLKGGRLVNWMQDMFPEVAEALGVGGGRLSRLCYGVIRAFRNRSLRSAAINVVLGERMEARLRQVGVQSKRIHVIPNWADGALVYPVAPSENPLRKKWGLESKFVIGYSGNLGLAHELETILAAMALLNTRHTRRRKDEAAIPDHPQVTFLFIGGGALYARLKTKIEELGLSDIQFRPYQPREQLADSLSSADVHLVSLRPELEGLIVPSKFYGIAAAGRPTLFIGDRDGEIPRLLKDIECGLTVRQGDGAGLARCILELAGDPERCRAMGERARAIFKQRFDKKIAIGKWEKLLDGLR